MSLCALVVIILRTWQWWVQVVSYSEVHHISLMFVWMCVTQCTYMYWYIFSFTAGIFVSFIAVLCLLRFWPAMELSFLLRSLYCTLLTRWGCWKISAPPPRGWQLMLNPSVEKSAISCSKTDGLAQPSAEKNHSHLREYGFFGNSHYYECFLLIASVSGSKSSNSVVSIGCTLHMFVCNNFRVDEGFSGFNVIKCTDVFCFRCRFIF